MNISDVDGNGYYDVNDFLKMKNEEILALAHQNDKLKENDGKRFDICLMNPPYNNGLHLSFLKKVSDFSNNIISIQPCNWLFLKSKQKRTKEVRDLINKYGADITVYHEGDRVFGSDAAFKSKIAITKIDTTSESNIKIEGLNDGISKYDNIDDVKLFGTNKTWESIYNKIIVNTDDKLESHAHVYKDLPRIIAYFQKVGHTVERDNIKDYEGKYVCNHGTMSGHININGGWCDDFYTLIGKGSKYIKAQKFDEVKDDLKIFYVFDTEEEAQNMINYLKTDFVRSIMFMCKIGQANICVDQYCPWQDFKEEWNDEKLFRKYNITKEEQEKIKEVLPDYYGIRK